MPTVDVINLEGQIVDDTLGVTLVGISTLAADVRNERLEHYVDVRSRECPVRFVGILGSPISLGIPQHLSDLFQLPFVCCDCL